MQTVNNLPPIEWLNLKRLKDRREAILFTSPSAEKSAQRYLQGINLTQTFYIDTADRSSIERLASYHIKAEVSYAVGGGRVIDVARFLARKWGVEIICIPTIISSDAFLVDCTGLRENGCVTYVPSKKADRVLLDWELLRKVPLKYHISGCGDVLSIYTGLYDWEYANKKKAAREDEPYSQAVAIMAKGILDGLLSEAQEIKRGTKRGLEVIITSLAMEVQLCNLYGSSRPEEGGEHFFTYCIENKIPHFLHGEMVSFGILITAYLQGERWEKLKSFMDYVGLNYKSDGITRTAITKTLKELPIYVKRHKLRYGIYNDFDYERNKEKINQFFEKVGL